MIAYIEGSLAETWEKSCLVLTSGGTGYRIVLPGHTFSALPERGQKVAFYTSMAVREDAIELFGFATFEERQTFEVLRAINKIGARTALAILSTYRPSELQQLVLAENVTALTEVPGIGQKTAQHVLLELKYKLGALHKSQDLPAQPRLSGVYGDTVAALTNLGYGDEESAGVVRGVLRAEPDLDVASAIRLALREFAARKG